MIVTIVLLKSIKSASSSVEKYLIPTLKMKIKYFFKMADLLKIVVYSKFQNPIKMIINLIMEKKLVATWWQNTKWRNYKWKGVFLCENQEGIPIWKSFIINKIDEHAFEKKKHKNNENLQ
jgi:hypothetical protein